MINLPLINIGFLTSHVPLLIRNLFSSIVFINSGFELSISGLILSGLFSKGSIEFF